MTLAALLAGGAARAAQDTAIPADFYGSYSGMGIAEEHGAEGFPMSSRDLDLIIAPQGRGFTVAWTTVIRSGRDAASRTLRRSSTVRTFLPSAIRSVWRAAENGDPLHPGGEFCWARITGFTLSVMQLAVLDNGTYRLEQYDRTLSGNGLNLKYTLQRNRQVVRTVSAVLVQMPN